MSRLAPLAEQGFLHYGKLKCFIDLPVTVSRLLSDATTAFYWYLSLPISDVPIMVWQSLQDVDFTALSIRVNY